MILRSCQGKLRSSGMTKPVELKSSRMNLAIASSFLRWICKAPSLMSLSRTLIWLAVSARSSLDDGLGESVPCAESCRGDRSILSMAPALESPLEGSKDGYRGSPVASAVILNTPFRVGGTPPTSTSNSIGWIARNIRPMHFSGRPLAHVNSYLHQKCVKQSKGHQCHLCTSPRFTQYLFSSQHQEIGARSSHTQLFSNAFLRTRLFALPASVGHHVLFISYIAIRVGRFGRRAVFSSISYNSHAYAATFLDVQGAN